jgi:heptosyltransferase III
MGGRRSPRILFIRPDHFGDVLLTLPAVAALRAVLPAAHLMYAVPAAVSSVPEHCPQLDATVPLSFPPPGSSETETTAWREEVRAAAAKLQGAVDAALVVRPDDPWSGELVAAARIPIRLGFDMPRTRPYLTDVLPVPGRRHVATHAFDLADAVLARLGAGERTTRAVRDCFLLSHEEEEEAASALAEAGADEHPIVLHPGSGWPLKNWPAQRWRRLAAEMVASFGTRPVVAGSAGERALVSHVVGAGSRAVGLAGRLSLGALAALHRRARLVVSTDSGALHLAALMGAPVVGLFGPADPAMFAPLCPPGRRRVLHAALPCSPCGTLEHPPCGATEEPECITAIPVQGVLQAAGEVIRAPAPGPTPVPAAAPS